MTLSSMIKFFCESLDTISVDLIEKVSYEIVSAINKNRFVFVCGNGGSGANANLFSTIISDNIKKNNLGSRILSLNSNMSTMTALAESAGYDKVFSFQLEKRARASDILVVISGSGNSRNIIEAVLTAKKLGMYTIGLTGMGGGRLSSVADLSIIVSSDIMEDIESIHTIIIHAISEYVVAELDCVK